MKLSTTIEITLSGVQLSALGLVDSGTTGTSINHEYIIVHRLETKKLPISILIYNVNSILNSGSAIEEFVEVQLIRKNTYGPESQETPP